MAVSGGVFTMSDTNTETLGNLLKQLGGLLGVGARSDGRYYLADMCTASSINKWSKYKPVPLRDSAGNDVTDNAYTKNRYYSNIYVGQQYRTGLLGNVLGDLGSYLEIAGMDVPIISIDENSSIQDNIGTIQSMIDGYASNGKNWPKIPWSRSGGYKRIRDFDGYDHSATCPFILDYDAQLHLGQIYNGIQVTLSINSNLVSVKDIFQTVLNDDFYFGVIFNNTLTLTDTKVSVGHVQINIPASVSTPLNTVKGYVFAYTKGKSPSNYIIPFPNDTGHPNPFSIKFTEYAGDDPFKDLSQPYITQSSNSPDTFGYDKSTPIGSMVSLSKAIYDGDYSLAPSTTGKFIFSATLTNVAANNADVVIVPTNVRVSITDNYGHKTIAIPTVYNSSMVALNSSFTIAGGQTVKLYFEISNVWSGMSPVASNTEINSYNFLTFQLTYKSSYYEGSSGRYPTQYPNLKGFFIPIAKPASTTYDNKVAVSSGSYGNAISRFASYGSV